LATKEHKEHIVHQRSWVNRSRGALRSA
jgi:hypothetical protein